MFFLYSNILSNAIKVIRKRNTLKIFFKFRQKVIPYIRNILPQETSIIFTNDTISPMIDRL